LFILVLLFTGCAAGTRAAHYCSITLSARSKKASEMFSPIALGGGQIDNEIELRRLLERHVSGLCPRRILSTYSAARRNILV
jgi:hypothetical protein